MANPQLIAEGRLRPEGYHHANTRSFLHTSGRGSAVAKTAAASQGGRQARDRFEPLLSVVAQAVHERVVA